MTRGLAFPKQDRFAKRDRVDYRKLALPKAPAEPDANFRGFVRDHGCQGRQRSPKLHHRCSPTVGTDYSRRAVIDFAHTPAKRAMGRKASDVGNGIGLCHYLHLEQHDIGWPRFAKKYDIDPIAIAQVLRDEYESKKQTRARR